jgi:hypothetical protein
VGVHVRKHASPNWYDFTPCRAIVSLKSAGKCAAPMGNKNFSNAGASAAPSGIPQYLVRVREQMTLAEKVAQMTQLDLLDVVDFEAAENGVFRLDDVKLAKYASAGIGAFLNSPTAGKPIGKLWCPDPYQWRDAMEQMHKAYVSAGKVRPYPMFYMKVCHQPCLQQIVTPKRQGIC